MSKPLELRGIEIEDDMRFMNRENPSVEFEDGTKNGGNHGCVGCNGDIRRANEMTTCHTEIIKHFKKRQILSQLDAKETIKTIHSISLKFKS